MNGLQHPPQGKKHSMLGYFSSAPIWKHTHCNNQGTSSQPHFSWSLRKIYSSKPSPLSLLAGRGPQRRHPLEAADNTHTHTAWGSITSRSWGYWTEPRPPDKSRNEENINDNGRTAGWRWYLMIDWGVEASPCLNEKSINRSSFVVEVAGLLCWPERDDEALELELYQRLKPDSRFDQKEYQFSKRASCAARCASKRKHR